jgi:2-keto-4-pentenoate hydratase/2-oxohepta-3-ene-1,7-dioic acid hydratase in catechol pathway
VIATGAPEGVGIGFKPPRFLQKGQVVMIEIDRIGSLRNPWREAACMARLDCGHFGCLYKK